MRVGGMLLVLASAAAAIVYGACGTARLGPIDGTSGGPDGSDTDTEVGSEPGDDAGAAKDATASDAEPRDAAPDATNSAWPCPSPSDAGTIFDREWVTGPVPTSSPGAANYALRSKTVCDRTTLLEWERAVGAQLRTWDQAVAYCDSLLLEGNSDWRLPTRIELLGIVDYTRKEPAIDPVVFPSTPAESFWSATLMSNVFDNPNAYLVVFDFGHAAPFTKSEPLNVRCVRGGR